MSENTMRSIFDPFFTTKSKGTGLGLSIVHRILESYNGRLRVESAIGRGSAFTMTLTRCHPEC
jgi:signal transduction histidine kinase